jgi:uncharacterized metal-binding protein YceD (DUF177 family)
VSWGRIVKLGEIGRKPLEFRLEPDAEVRARIARDLGLESLPAFSARIEVGPWLDGAEITGHVEAVVEQICGVTLDPFEQRVFGEVKVCAVPAGSPNAPIEEAGEIERDPEDDDPPDVLEGEEIDLSAYAVEALGLLIDPFPRKPDAEFVYVNPTEDDSPFAVLKGLKDLKS